MSRYMYSASTGGFYLEGVHGDSIPADAVEISQAEHTALLAAQSSGKIIQPDANGHPVAVEPPAPEPPTYDQLRKQEILAAWPIESQLEAWSENAEDPSRPEKLNQMQADFAAIRAKYPKPESVADSESHPEA